jgi:TusA-related sulfurtransferase
MTNVLRPSFLAAVVLFSVACGDSGGGAPTGSAAKPATSGSAPKPVASTPAKASASATGSAAAADDERGKMGNCPNAAPGAKTAVKDVDKGVEVTVTATDAKVTEDVRTRAKSIAERAKGESNKPQHSGQGGGGGVMGRCPIVLGGTELKVEDVEGGSKFTVTVKDAAEVDWLRRETKERLAVLEEPGAEGERKMANCPSAAKDSKTSVKEAGGAIVVTVVAKDPKNEAVVKDVRERAKKTGETKHAGEGKTHGGTGAGGGKEGRCPAVLEETEATVKDVDGGSEITLKPKKKEDLKKLLEEAKSRAKPFE